MTSVPQGLTDERGSGLPAAGDVRPLPGERVLCKMTISCQSQMPATRQPAPRLLSFHVHVTDVLSGPDGLCLERHYRVEI